MKLILYYAMGFCAKKPLHNTKSKGRYGVNESIKQEESIASGGGCGFEHFFVCVLR